MIYDKMSSELQEIYLKRINNCVECAERTEKGSWAHKYWMQVAGKLTRDLAANQYGAYNRWNIS